MGIDLRGPEGETPIQAIRRLTALKQSLKYDGMGFYTGGPNNAGCDVADMDDLNSDLACSAMEAVPLIEEMVSAMREAREELFRAGESSSSAWEHGDRVSRAEADRYADEIHAKLDAAIAKAS